MRGLRGLGIQGLANPVFSAGCPGGISYLLYDEFTDTRAAGSVNGTPATPGPGTRVVVDTNGKVTVGLDVINFTTGAAANDGIWYDLITRELGRTLVAKIAPSNTAGLPAFGFDANQSGAITDALIFSTTTGLQIIQNGGTAFTVGAYTGATDYYLAATMRASGIYWFIKGGLFTYWTMLMHTVLGAANAYPAITAQNATSVFTADTVRVPETLFIPTPLYTDTFTRANGAIGSTEAVGPDSQVLTPKTWTGATWTVATNKAVNTPVPTTETVTDGDMEAADMTAWTNVGTPVGVAKSAVQAHGGTQSAAVDGNSAGDGIGQTIALTAGKWYLATAWTYGPAAPRWNLTLNLFNTDIVTRIYSQGNSWGIGYGTGRSDGVSRMVIYTSQRDAGTLVAYVDDVGLKELALSELIASVNVGTPDVIQRVKVAAINSSGQASGMQVGGAIRVNSDSAPTSGIIYYFNNAKVYCDEFTTATTWTNLFNAAKAFTANDELIIWASGANIRVYHMTSAGVVTLVGQTTTASVLTGNYAGIFSTHQTNTVEEISCMPVGTGGEF